MGSGDIVLLAVIIGVAALIILLSNLILGRKKTKPADAPPRKPDRSGEDSGRVEPAVKTDSMPLKTKKDASGPGGFLGGDWVNRKKETHSYIPADVVCIYQYTPPADRRLCRYCGCEVQSREQICPSCLEKQ